MNPLILNFFIGIIEGEVPNSKPLVDALEAQVKAGKLQSGDIETDTKDLLVIAKNYLPKFGAFFDDLVQDITDVDKTVADFKAAQAA